LTEWWRTQRERYEKLVAEYGWTAVGVYVSLYLGTWFAFWVAITQGIDVGTAAAGAGTIGGAWVATKVTQPIRIGATLVITPLVVAGLRRLRLRSVPPPA
jgi:hypothetical protein